MAVADLITFYYIRRWPQVDDGPRSLYLREVPEVVMSRKRTGTLLVLAAVVLAAGLAAGCRQSRPLPMYQPLLALEANQPGAQAAKGAAEMYRPSWSAPRPGKPRKGG
jgi:hypothetical protein